MNLSGSLSPQLGKLSKLIILDVMWNQINGSIPKEIGNITSLELLLLNGNQLTGSLPDELGFLPNLDRIQIDENHISGPLSKSFANLNNTRHFHMNNNSISGQIPPELSRLPKLIHFLLDNNNLSGYLPPEFSDLPQLRIVQLDNNHFDGTTIPASYGNMSRLKKLSLRNCGLQGEVPDLSTIPKLGYIDLSWNQLSGSIPSNKLSDYITTIDLAYNNLNGTIPSNFSNLPRLQRLSLENNSLSGDVPSTIWQDLTINGTQNLLLDFQNNELSNISSTLNPPANVSIRLYGNPVCNQPDIVQFCGSQTGGGGDDGRLADAPRECLSECPEYYELVKNSPNPCFCAAPLRFGYRLKSPTFSDFPAYENQFEVYLTGGLGFQLYQLSIVSVIWEYGPRLTMSLKIFPSYNNQTPSSFNDSEILRIRSIFMKWTIPDNDIFGPYELLNTTYDEPEDENSGLSTGAVVGIVLGAVAGSVTLSIIITILVMRRHAKKLPVSKKSHASRASIKIEGVKGFTFEEMALATNNFSDSSQIGQGGYGKVYKGILADGTIVAVKRALQGSLQGEKEFFTEIELLSRVHHRNLVSLIGYCDEEDEQMLVYEFMPNGTLRDYLSDKSKGALGFGMRLRMALASAKGILYLHTEADPPIFHRDIKASNILLDSRFTAKVADFGLSRLAPVPDIGGIVPGHISTVVKGTPGYLDPEYFITQKLTDKSDVYSLGVVFLELLTGLPPISHGKNIVREVNLVYQSGQIFSVVDENMGAYPSECVEKFVTLAIKCCQDVTDARPSMADVVRELENIRVMMPKADTGPSESVDIEPKKGKGTPPSSTTGTKNPSSESVDIEPKKGKGTPPSSTTGTKNPYVSSDVSGSDLISGVFPTIAPR